MRERSSATKTYTARQRGFLGREYVVSGDGADVVVAFRGFRGEAHFALDGRGYRVLSRGWRGRLVLQEDSGRELAAVDPSGFLSSRQLVRLPDRQIEVATRGFWRRAWEVRHGDRVVGTIRVRGVLRPTLEADLPGELAPEFRFLLLVLIIVLRRRAAAAAAASS